MGFPAGFSAEERQDGRGQDGDDADDGEPLYDALLFHGWAVMETVAVWVPGVGSAPSVTVSFTA